LPMEVVTYLAVAAASFLVGAIPFSWLLGKLAGLDLRGLGSGNPGATNLYRAAGWRWALPALLLDVAKGFLPVVLVSWFLSGLVAAAVVAAGAAIAGHMWTPYLGFRGGKGVATAAGAFLALSPLLILITFAVFVAVVAATRYVSLGSVVAACVAFVGSFALPLSSGQPVDPYFVVLCGVCAAAIIVAHRRNISRLLAGTERKMGKGKEDGR
jgi:glycerol-3-phosphate acyltransferase PlsY